MKWPFKKYNGWDVKDIAQDDPQYLKWCLENLTLRSALKKEVEECLASRKHKSPPWPCPKHNGMDIYEIAVIDPEYLEWCLDNAPISDDLKEIIEDALFGGGS